MAKYGTDSGAVVRMARGVQWCEQGTPLYGKVINTGREAVVVRCGHPIAKVIALNIRDSNRFRVLFVHPLPPVPDPSQSPANNPPAPVPVSGNNANPTRGLYSPTPTSGSSA